MNDAALKQYVSEVAGGDPDIAAKMLEILGSKPEAATRFADGFLRRDDYTKKTQEAAEQKKKADQLMGKYSKDLEDAEKRIKAVLKEAADDKISAATANARLQSIKKTYALDDTDIPDTDDLKKIIADGKVPKGAADIDIEARMEAFKKELLGEITNKLIPELSGMAALPIVWNSIEAEHRELTGKSLTKKERQELLQDASTSKKSLDEVWTEKYKIENLRESKSDEGKKAKWKDEWEKEQQAKRTEEALSGGAKRGGVEMVPDSQRSPLLRKNFRAEEEQDGKGQDDKGKQKDDRQQNGQKMSGADRATASFIARRAKGIGWGQVETKAS